jgi:hypothetical protein
MKFTEVVFVVVVSAIGGLTALSVPRLVQAHCPEGSWCSFLRVFSCDASTRRTACLSQEEARSVYRLATRAVGLNEQNAPPETFLRGVGGGGANQCFEIGEVVKVSCTLVEHSSFYSGNMCRDL